MLEIAPHKPSSSPGCPDNSLYARIVLEHAVRRRYIDAAQQVAEVAWNRR
jgi:hypothetical protein